jgi:uncharacterized protein (DUF58 family)
LPDPFRRWPETDTLRPLRAAARSVAQRLRLPLRRPAWRGLAGNWAGTGRGSSLDFQDHRPYLPGDDPRHINWQAYARTGSYSMKLYREEVSPLVDLVLDASSSMLFEASKRDRGLELALFAIESATALGASPRLFAVSGGVFQAVPGLELGKGALPDDRGHGRLSLDGLPFRPGSLRVLVSDCLVAGPPDAVLRTLVSSRGRAVVLAPGSLSEAEPDWEGHLELLDCETGEKRLQHVDAALRRRYGEAYGRHFEIWRTRARRHGVAFARVPSEGPLLEALQKDALAEGAVEPAA